MLTVKTIIERVVTVEEKKTFTVARNGSPRFKSILEKTGHMSNPDFLIFVPPVFRDEECKEILQEEDIIQSERDDISLMDEDAIGIIIEDVDSDSGFGNIIGGVMYRFIYYGDEVYVMNSNGATIETIR